MIGTTPPFSLTAPAFRFRALTTIAGRAPLGGERETALAMLMAARLAHGTLPPWPLSESSRRLRAAGARVWFSTMTLPAAMRIPLARLVEATEGTSHVTIAETLMAVAELAQSVLDQPARSEIADLIATLREQ